MQEPDIPINKRVYSDGEGKQPLLHTLVAVVTLLVRAHVHVHEHACSARACCLDCVSCAPVPHRSTAAG